MTTEHVVAKVGREGLRSPSLAVFSGMRRACGQMTPGSVASSDARSRAHDGMTFSVDSRMVTRGHKSAFGLHEMDERKLVRRWMPARCPGLKSSGGMGAVSCFVNRRLEGASRYWVVEAPAICPSSSKIATSMHATSP